jgi:hypothetical protein
MRRLPSVSSRPTREPRGGLGDLDGYRRRTTSAAAVIHRLRSLLTKGALELAMLTSTNSWVVAS